MTVRRTRCPCEKHHHRARRRRGRRSPPLRHHPQRPARPGEGLYQTEKGPSGGGTAGLLRGGGMGAILEFRSFDRAGRGQGRGIISVAGFGAAGWTGPHRASRGGRCTYAAVLGAGAQLGLPLAGGLTEALVMGDQLFGREVFGLLVDVGLGAALGFHAFVFFKFQRR